MTTAEKEKIVQTWPFPYPQYLEQIGWSRDQRLKSPTCTDEDKNKIEADYEEKLNRMFQQSSN